MDGHAPAVAPQAHGAGELTPSTGAPADHLVALLRRRATDQPDLRGYTFLEGGEREEAHLTFAALDARARAIGAALARGGARGERVLLLYPPGVDYVAGFFGCLYAGAVAVPVYPPDLSRPARTLPRLAAIAADAQARFALTTAPILGMAQVVFDAVPELAALAWIASDALDPALADEWRDPAVTASSLAFLQYTSGSTASPRGVMLTHANLLHNLSLIQRCFGTTPESLGVIWLPPYHDMGLIGGLLQSLYLGCPVVLMSPLDFLRRPIRWLRAISRYRATTSGGPNFAYDLAVRKTTPAEREGLDLSSWDLAFNGAEPIHPETLRRFSETFAPYGFRAEAHYPCYGLAEGTLIASGGTKLAPTIVRPVRAAALREHRVEPAVEGEVGVKALVGCGRALPDQRIAIARPETGAPCAPGEIGEIWLAGPSVASGYWNRPAESERTFGATLAGDPEGTRFLRTGDLGFLDADGELLVVGRLKDLVIIRGRNHHPQDLERTAEAAHPALRPGCGAAFSIEEEGEERLVVVQEIDRRAAPDADPAAIARAIREAVTERHEVPVRSVVLIAAGSIPKTSSGKIQRHACKQELLAGTLEIVHRDDRAGAEALETEAGAPAEEAAPPEAGSLRRAIEGVPAAARREAIVAALRAEAARALRLAPEAVDPARSLYALGLDSLAAIELRGALEAGFGVELPLAGMLDDPTLLGLAEAIDARLGSAAPARAAQAAEAEAPSGEAPMSGGQQALWFLHRLAPESSAYHVPVALRVRGPIDAAALRRTFERLVARHDALRTTFAMTEGGPVQRVHPALPPDFAALDAAGLDEAVLDERVRAEARRPFDLERGPLVRIRLWSRAAADHVLLVAFHHIAVDLWSIAVLAEELDRIYPEEVAGRAPAVEPPPSFTPADFAREQAREVAAPRGAAALAHFRERLEGELPLLDLPLDRPRPPSLTDRGRVHAARIDAELAAALKRLARAHGTTLNVLLQAAFQVLLHRHSGQHDLVLGVVGAGRTRPAHARLVGYCVNPIPIRARPSPRERFLDHLAATRSAVIEAIEHQDYPFNALVAALQPPRDPSRSPIFQAMFVFQRSPRLDERGLTALALDLPGARATLAGLPLESLALPTGAAQFELTLTMGEAEGGLACAFEYNADLFAEESIARMARRFAILLEGIAADPTRRLADLPLMTEAEHAAIEAAARGAAGPTGPGLDVPSRIAAAAARAGEATAVLFRDERISYPALHARAERIAAELASRGAGPGAIVGVCLDRSIDMIAAALGVLRAGAAYVPLDPSHPPERLALLAAGARARLVLTAAAHRDRVAGGGRECLALDSDIDWTGPPPVTPPPPSIDGAELACLIYTSGSTGAPKAGMLTHGGLANLAASFIESYAVGPADRVLPLTALASASFVGEILPPLCAGAAVVLPTLEETLDVDRLVGLIGRAGVTIASTVPAVIAALGGARSRGPLAPLRLLLSGGEALAAADVRDLLAEVEVVNGYGLTETTVCATYHRLRAEDLDAGARPPIGRPIRNAAVYVLDEELQPVPAGCAGEIHVGGAGLARGYLDDPALTAERFRPDPFGAPGARMYHTGDLGRRRDDGAIDYLHRVDHQVKIRGHRVELGEIEAAIRRHPKVAACFVMAREDAPGERLLAAYVVPTEADALGPEALARALGERLPAYMVPPAIVLLPSLPLSANGKVDARALPVPSGGRVSGADFTPPRSELERRIAEVWREVLKVPPGARVGTADNFFDLGGDSLRLARAHQRLREVLGVELSLIDLFKHTTVAALAAHLESTRGGGSGGDGDEARRIRDEAERRREAQRRRQLGRRGPPR